MPGSPQHHAHQPKTADTHDSSAPSRQHGPCASHLPLCTSNSNQPRAPLPQAEMSSSCDASKEDTTPRRVRHTSSTDRVFTQAPNATIAWCHAMVPTTGKNDAQRAPPPSPLTSSAKAFTRISTKPVARSQPWQEHTPPFFRNLSARRARHSSKPNLRATGKHLHNPPSLPPWRRRHNIVDEEDEDSANQLTSASVTRMQHTPGSIHSRSL
jgi:hypothetical protein